MHTRHAAYQGPCQMKRLASACEVGVLSGSAHPLLVEQALLEEVRRLPDVVCVLNRLLKKQCSAAPVQRLHVSHF